MFYQEKRTIVSLVGSVLIAVMYAVYVYRRYQEGSLDLPNDLASWASATLILIPVAIGLQIIIHIIFAIINVIITREEEPDISDEREVLISLKTTRNVFFVFMLGLLISFGTVVINMPLYVMFVVITFSLIGSTIIGDLWMLYYYRRGV